MRSIVLPYKPGSRSARALATALGINQVNLSRSVVHSMQPRKIINWGNSGANLPPEGLGFQHEVINPLGVVANASCKLRTTEILDTAGVSVPEHTSDATVARQWASEGNQKVVCRTILNGNSGAGIVIANTPDEVVPARLYTKYIPKEQEYRVHVAKKHGTYYLFDLQQKRRSSSVPDDQVDWNVRNVAGGFIFAREGINAPTGVIREAIKAVEALGLDFGAVDVIWNAYRSRAFVLEVNTAPGLEGTTLERYTNMASSLVSGDAEWLVDQHSLLSTPLIQVEQEIEPSEEPVVELQERDPFRVQEVQEVQEESPSNPEQQSLQFDGNAPDVVFGIFFGSSLITESGVWTTEEAANQELRASPLLINLSRNGSLTVRPVQINE